MSRQSFGERRRRVGDGKAPVVNPMWPMLAMMFAGVWVAWPWFLLNEALMKSDDLRRQAKLVLLGLLGSTVVAAVVIALVEVELLGVREARYVVLLLVTWKLGISYVLHARQLESFSLWQYFGGAGRSGLYVMLAAAYLAGALFDKLPFGVLWLVLR
jgi:hypothetical protein